jgi:hydroxymethylbilane synthase
VSPARELRLGTRGSQLALWQARAVASRIASAGGPECDVVVIKTTGDRLHDAQLSEVGGKRLFVKEIEEALLDGRIDLAVHSSKDMPAVMPVGLAIGGVLAREDPRDAVVLPSSRSHTMTSIEELVGHLGSAPVLATSSVRRASQLAHLIPGARFVPIRGNLNTRLSRLDGGGHDALVLAAAGLRRLGLESRLSMCLPVSACVPAPGQGIIAIEVREGDEPARRIAESVNDPAARAALAAEWSLVEFLHAGCQSPLGALATPVDDRHLELVAVVAAPDGSRMVRADGKAAAADAAALGARVAAKLVARGAGDILRRSGGVTSEKPS